MADEHSGITTRENGLLLPRVGNQRLYAAIQGKWRPMPRPQLSGIWAVPYAPPGRAQTDAVIRPHEPSPVSVAASVRNGALAGSAAQRKTLTGRWSGGAHPGSSGLSGTFDGQIRIPDAAAATL